MLVSLDIETKSITDDPEDALIPHLSKITCVGVWCPDFEIVFRNLSNLQKFIEENRSIQYIGHNFQFDLKHLEYHGVNIPLDSWIADTQLMASVCLEKIPDEWLEEYELARKEANKNLPKGFSHRAAKGLSLKTLAPYFLDVDPFWETPDNHDNDEYVLKDCQYTFLLWAKLDELLGKQNLKKFYSDRVHEWAKMVTRSVIKGIEVDLVALNEAEIKTNHECEELEQTLYKNWQEAFKAYENIQKEKIKNLYKEKLNLALEKAKDKNKCKKRYDKLLETALLKIEPFNLNSPLQLNWLFKEYFNYDIHNFDGEESTGKEVLQKLGENHDDVKTFFNHRKVSKLLTAFYPTYKKLVRKEGTIHCSFNIGGTRTGRLSSSDPNLQQVPGHLHSLFKARQGYTLITRDQSAIEPRLIAFITEDESLCRLILRDGNFHSFNAKAMFQLTCEETEVADKYPYERKVAKEIGLAMLYGAGPKRIQASAQKYGKSWSIEYCREIYENFKALYPQVFEYKKQLDFQAKNMGRIENLFGRIHVYPNEEDIYMKCFNTLIQSSASDLLIEGVRKFEEHCSDYDIDAYPLLYVHDEVVIESRDDTVDKATSLLDSFLTGFDLETKHGKLSLKVEGAVNKVWKK